MPDTSVNVPSKGWLARLQALSRLGSEGISSVSARRKVVQTNVAALLGVGSCLIYSTAYLLTGRLGFVVCGLLLFLYLPFFLYSLQLSRLGRILAAKWLFFGTANAVIATTASIQGRSIDVQLYFLLFCVIAPMLFERRQWRHMMGCVLVSLTLFAVASVAPYSPPQFYTDTVGSDLLDLYRSLIQFTCVAALIILVMVSEYSSAGSEMDLQRMAETDVLTGVPNRRAFQAMFRRHVEQVHRDRPASSPVPRLCLLLMDIDHFKHINDEYGHDCGDEVLRRVAAVLHGELRRSDMLARVGGEEFAVLIRNVDEDQATQLAERLCQSVAAAHFEIEGQHIPVTLSGGFAFAGRGLSESRLYSLADSALYRAKHAGRNRVERSDPTSSMLATEDDTPGLPA
ncbi:GGDEF domain-containing protein [Amphibiibacter pelophylacis]|uniref:GGDEF domain-containing protein n=1 Tax=Amphibiibacter pelophylacis TaxID=1799477 RepID=A0ACC6P0U7_9BURK